MIRSCYVDLVGGESPGSPAKGQAFSGAALSSSARILLGAALEQAQGSESSRDSFPA
jgi:hypothetical protein